MHIHNSWLCIAALATAALFMAPSPATQHKAPHRLAVTYADWLTPYIGKDFYLNADFALAVEKRHVTVAPNGAREFKLTAVGQDFVCFENPEDRVCVPITALRSFLSK